MTDFNKDHPLDFGLSDVKGTEKLEIGEDVTNSWLQTAGWCTFLGALMFFIILVIALAYRAAMASYFGVDGVATIVLVIISILTAIPGVLYWRAGAKIRLGFMRSETEEVESGFRHLLWVYRYSGILFILYLTVLFFVLLFGILKNILQ